MKPSVEQWLWLGSEAGIVYLLKVGVSSLHVGTSVSFNVKSPVECLLFHNNRVWAGLRDGRIALFQLQPGKAMSLFFPVNIIIIILLFFFYRYKLRVP